MEASVPQELQKDWRRHPGSNRGITDLQSVALPLGYAAARESVQKCTAEPASINASLADSFTSDGEPGRKFLAPTVL